MKTAFCLVFLIYMVATNSDECGPDLSETAPFISALTGGNEEPLAPWLAAIGISRPNEEFTVICSGSILNRRFILTGASCFLSERYYPSHVRVGARHIESRFAEEREILDVKIHPDFDGVNRTFYFDIAIITVDRELLFSGFSVISPICLPDSSLLYPVSGLGISVHGWGTKRGQGKEKDASQVNVNIRSKGSLSVKSYQSRKNFTAVSLSSKKC